MGRDRRKLSQAPCWVAVQLEDLNKYAFWRAHQIAFTEAYVDASEHPHREARSVIKRHLQNFGHYVDLALPLAAARKIIQAGASFRAQQLAQQIEVLEQERDAVREESRETYSMLSEKIATLQFQTETFTNVDENRIRRCPICHRLYWMRRSDAGACSPKCDARLRGYKAFMNRQLREALKSQ